MKIQRPKKETEIIKIIDDGFYYKIGEKNKKKVTYDEIEEAIKEISEKGIITRQWYKDKFPKTSKNNPCNFTTIGGILVKVELAEYTVGKYLYKKNKSNN
ncbi:hypothetical protein [Clostridium sp. ATCC 25772]|uniref:hypothetical protein n=1 Tax=Clostridium sp. ATCC 25772 TaxID=1676991 RepID=UPI000A9E1B47|nr:hypothetical protein [Clostridium sp. ATCC 25772]